MVKEPNGLRLQHARKLVGITCHHIILGMKMRIEQNAKSIEAFAIMGKLTSSLTLAGCRA
jgi:hypothetical protein